MTLRSKLLLAQAPLAVAVLLLAYVGQRTLQSVGRSSQGILKDNYQSVLAAQAMKESLERIDSAAIFMVAGRSDLAVPQGATNQVRFEQELRVQENNITEPGEREATQGLRRLWTEYLQAYDGYIKLPGPDLQRDRYFSTLQPLFVRVKDAADVILAINQDAMIRKSDAAARATNHLTSLLLLAAAATFLIGVGSTTSLTGRLLRPLFALSDAVRRIGEGDMAARALVIGRDEISNLAREFNTMAERLAQYRRSSLGELLQAQQSSQAAIDGMPDPVVLFGDRGEVLSVNQAASSLFGMALEVGVGDPLQKAPPPVREALEHVRAHILGGKGAYTPRGFEEALRVQLPAGERFFLPRGSPVHGETGGVAGAAVVLQDVTRLLFFDQLKTDMVATVAHEFRTPLTSLHMAIHLCLEGAAGPITEKQADLLQAAREDCERLQSVVNELLDASRIQSGKLELHLRAIAPMVLLDTARELAADAEARGLHLTTSDESSAGDQIEADVERLRLVLTNLIQNALRHTPAGGEVRVRAVPKSGVMRFEVSDTGEGVAPEYHQKIFEKYFQVPGVSSGSAGLGLYISREVVVEHGGTMGVESEAGKGSTFWFEIPMVPEAGTREGK